MIVPQTDAECAKQKKQWLFKVVFNKGDGNAKKDLLIACQNHTERVGWVRAFHKYQLQIMEYKMKYFRERLDGQK